MGIFGYRLSIVFVRTIRSEFGSACSQRVVDPRLRLSGTLSQKAGLAEGKVESSCGGERQSFAADPEPSPTQPIHANARRPRETRRPEIKLPPPPHLGGRSVGHSDRTDTRGAGEKVLKVRAACVSALRGAWSVLRDPDGTVAYLKPEAHGFHHQRVWISRDLQTISDRYLTHKPLTHQIQVQKM